MKKKFSFLFVIGILGLIMTACGSKENNELKTNGTLTVGMEGTYAPYAYRENGKLKGFEVDLAKEVAKKMDLKVKFVPTKWDSLIAGLNSGTFDVVFNNMDENPDRKKQYSFASPYIYTKSALITKKDSKLTDAKDIKGKKIGEGIGTDNYNNAKKLGANIVVSPDFQTTMDMINQGRIVGAINSQEAFLNWRKTHQKTDLTYHVVPDNVIKTSNIAPMLNKKSPETTKKMSKAIDELRKDGTLKKLSNKYFDKNITDK
ncbi:transporter substrate-binding domain-containing protein [Lactobacillus sp. S2-2]|uniref:transporter substrate-binding domain-containing protein n=1 Tax=Lactobacillus sp. S2-2 TaxID=2692917 RepID=UPI001F3238A6|nr:transporter substrate-binding domain-containing protein [Lactobacillus sp. S2-2]MCF6515189.1 transporter substrate-binding domain-containing protein [Lactobacillus sp. S2-2]